MGSDVIMSSIPPKWREQATRRASEASRVIQKMTCDITTEDWSLERCQDYLVELEMATCGAMMALRLTDNDICSERVSQQVEHLSSKAREAKNMALELRQKQSSASWRRWASSAVWIRHGRRCCTWSVTGICGGQIKLTIDSGRVRKMMFTTLFLRVIK